MKEKGKKEKINQKAKNADRSPGEQIVGDSTFIIDRTNKIVFYQYIMTEDTLNNKTPWQDLTIGGNIYTAGNAKEFKTGDWRSTTPVFKSELCKHCGLCYPVCPDDAIPVNPDGTRRDFDYDACKGCGVCAKVCPFKAIEMK